MEMDLLLKNPSFLDEERHRALLELLESSGFEDSEFLKSKDFHRIFHDVWSLFEIGEEYKNEIAEEAVNLKEWRIFILEFFASRNMEKMQFEYLTNSSVKKFIISLYIMKKIVRKYFAILEKTLEFQKIKDEYAEDFSKNTVDIAFQKEILLRLQNNWFMNLFKFNSTYDKVVEEILQETYAVEQLFGQDVWETISNDNLKNFMHILESRHFSEVLFWKSKFQTESFLKLDLNSNSTYVFCVQKDSSMKLSLNVQSGLALAVSEFSQQNEHNFIFLSFDQKIEKEMIALKGYVDVNRYLELDKSFSENTESIDFKSTINYAFTMLKLGLSHREGGKVYILCNEQLFENLPSDDEWRLAVSLHKKTTNIEIAVIYIGDQSKLQPIWFADKILFPHQLAQFE